MNWRRFVPIIYQGICRRSSIKSGWTDRSRYKPGSPLRSLAGFWNLLISMIRLRALSVGLISGWIRSRNS